MLPWIIVQNTGPKF